MVELHDPIYERRADGQLVVQDQRWIGLLIPERLADSRQQAVEILQRYAVNEKGWESYPGSAGVTGPYMYVDRHGELARAVRWAPGDLEVGRFWRAVLGQGMDGGTASAVTFADPLDLDALDD